MPRLAVSCAALLSATALAAACSVYDESLLGAGGVDDTTSTRSGGDGDGDGGRGGAGATSTSDASTSDASTSSEASTGQSGTVTTGAQCDTPDDCPGVATECATITCEEGQCGVLNEEAGFVIARQTAGDCIVQVCDGQGIVVSDVDDSDVAPPTEDCLIPVCNDGVKSNVAADEGDACGAGGTFFCTAAGACVECLDDGDCPENCSEQNTCVEAECDDGELNGTETDTDCGGPNECPRCANGDDCDAGTDCVSGSCNGTCQPSCSDDLVNGDETDVDCGGPDCDPCAIGLACDVEDDCGSGFCLSNACRPALFFSEYVEGAGQNKALEVFNYGNEDVDMSVAGANCSVSIYTNGSTSAGATIGLTGTIVAFETWVIAKSGGSPAPSPTMLAAADQQSGSLAFNGDDAVSLQCGGVVLDVIGQIGDFPDAVGWGTGMTNTLNHTLRRNGGITEGDRNGADAFDPADEWVGFASDTFGGLGVHP